jgi:hypothetical protein
LAMHRNRGFRIRPSMHAAGSLGSKPPSYGNPEAEEALDGIRLFLETQRPLSPDALVASSHLIEHTLSDGGFVDTPIRTMQGPNARPAELPHVRKLGLCLSKLIRQQWVS